MKKLVIYFRHAHRQKVCLYLELVSNYDAFEVFPKHLLKTCLLVSRISFVLNRTRQYAFPAR